MAVKKPTRNQHCNQPESQIDPITEDELIKLVESGFVSIDELIIGAELNKKEAAYLKKNFSQFEPAFENNPFESPMA